MTSEPTIQVLSAGAPKAGVSICLETYRELTGRDYSIEFATAPVIEKRVMSGHLLPDVVVAPVATLEAIARTDYISVDSCVTIGSITAGVVVRDGMPNPDISTTDTLIAAMRNAEGLVYNQASSGQYIDTLINKLGIYDAVKAKIVRVPTGAAVMEHVAGRADRVIGFGQMTEIRLHETLGVHLVGPLPAQVGRKTTYAAGLTTKAKGGHPATEFLAFLDSAEGRQLISETGVERLNR